MSNTRVSPVLRVGALALLCAGMALPIDGFAAKFTLMNDAVEGSFDSILNWGVSWRVGDADNDLKGANNGGNRWEAGEIFLNRITGTHELSLVTDNVGAFFRASYYYDYANDEEDLDIPGISEEHRRARHDVELLDAYIYGDIGNLRWRLGSQVISWGENTFLLGNLNDIHTFDLTKLRAAGSNLKDAILPTEAAYVQWNVTDSFSLEAFTLFKADQLNLDAAGTFFNSNAAITWGGLALGPLARISSNHPRSGGQWGVAARYYTGLLNGMELGAYRYRVHSHNPYLSVVGGAAQFFLDYPEDIDYWGLSFNTAIFPWAISGEWSHRRNTPIQAAGFFSAGLGAPSDLTGGVAPVAGTVVQGYERITNDQIQVTFQRTYIPRVIGADNSNFIAEIAAGWNEIGSADFATFTPITHFYWGYQARYSVDYNRAILNVINLTPQIAFDHDVNGVSHEVSPTFLEGSKSVSLSLQWSYLLDWEGSISYTHSWGGKSIRNAFGGEVRGTRDRNWMSVNVSYQF